MTEAARMQALREFGVSPYASRAYLALLELGPSDARSVSRHARVPAPKVYATLNQLMEKGLARLILGTPRRYEPVPFADYLAQRRASHLEEAQRLAQVAPALAPLFPVAARQVPSDRGGFAVLRGRQPVLRRLRDLAAQTRSSLLLAPSDGALLRASSLHALLADASANGVRPQLLLCQERANQGALDGLADVRVSPTVAGSAVGYAIFDRKDAVLSHHVPDDGEGAKGQDVAVHISESAIAASLHDLLAARWLSARAPALSRRAR